MHPYPFPGRNQNGHKYSDQNPSRPARQAKDCWYGSTCRRRDDATHCAYFTHPDSFVQSQPQPQPQQQNDPQVLNQMRHWPALSQQKQFVQLKHQPPTAQQKQFVQLKQQPPLSQKQQPLSPQKQQPLSPQKQQQWQPQQKQQQWQPQQKQQPQS